MIAGACVKSIGSRAGSIPARPRSYEENNMGLTVSAMEEELIEEFRPYMTLLRMDVSTKDGNNANLRSVIRRAVEACGGTIADFPYITDADIATITAGAGRLWLVARIYLLEKLWDWWAKFD